MSDALALRNQRRGELSVFTPQEAKDKIAQADAVIDYASRVGEWPLLDAAVDAKLDEQERFVGWWRANVTPRRQAGTITQNGVKVADAEELTGIAQQQVSKWAKWLATRDVYRARVVDAAHRKILDNPNHRSEGTGENEWYTPVEFIAAARSVMGSIDLDPASCAEAQEVIQATRYYTAADDGLRHEWAGNVWLNPPYSRDLIWRFTIKLAEEFTAGRVRQAILLTHNNTDTAWFHDLGKVAAAICLVRGRIRFYRGEEFATAPNGQVFFYLGSDVAAFAAVFGSEGMVVRPFP